MRNAAPTAWRARSGSSFPRKFGRDGEQAGGTAAVEERLRMKGPEPEHPLSDDGDDAGTGGKDET
jgi:hypothetical protein